MLRNLLLAYFAGSATVAGGFIFGLGLTGVSCFLLGVFLTLFAAAWTLGSRKRAQAFARFLLRAAGPDQTSERVKADVIAISPLDQIAQSLAKKTFSRLNPAEQALVQQIAVKTGVA